MIVNWSQKEEGGCLKFGKNITGKIESYFSLRRDF